MGNSVTRIFRINNAVYMDFQEYSIHKRHKKSNRKAIATLWYSNLQFNVDSDFPVIDSLRDYI